MLTIPIGKFGTVNEALKPVVPLVKISRMFFPLKFQHKTCFPAAPKYYLHFLIKLLDSKLQDVLLQGNLHTGYFSYRICGFLHIPPVRLSKVTCFSSELLESHMVFSNLFNAEQNSLGVAGITDCQQTKSKTRSEKAGSTLLWPASLRSLETCFTRKVSTLARYDPELVCQRPCGHGRSYQRPSSGGTPTQCANPNSKCTPTHNLLQLSIIFKTQVPSKLTHMPTTHPVVT